MLVHQPQWLQAPGPLTHAAGCSWGLLGGRVASWGSAVASLGTAEACPGGTGGP